jgi:hypothetical protein
VVTLDFATGDNNINGTVVTTNFKVVPVGQPGDGQVWILVDGPQCNSHSDLGMLLPYNTTIPSTEPDGPMDGTSFGAGIDYCFNAPPQDIKIAGMHTLTAELHRSDGSPVQVAGKTVSASITVDVQLAPDDGGTDAGTDSGTGPHDAGADAHDDGGSDAGPDAQDDGGGDAGADAGDGG